MRTKALTAALALTLAASALTPAQARHRAHHWNWPRATGQHYANLSGECRRAAALGGPCGCFASEYFFGRSIRSLWPHFAWLKFPRTSPHAGAAAISHRHVVPVLAAHGDGTITVHDSWGDHRVRAAGLVFVEPR